ncbi:MAG: hypothetical protein FGM16_07040 [Flavobacterium sp.]|nr:hypothetical protein [Flavobacterium sp.]
MKNNLLVLITLSLLTFVSCNIQSSAEYKFIGKFNYQITNDSLFSNTYLSPESFGYLIGDLNIQGIKINGIENLKKDNSDFIISLNYPISEVLNNSDLIQNEGMEHIKKKPLEIRKDLSRKTNDVYIYKLSEKGKYRLLLP